MVAEKFDDASWPPPPFDQRKWPVGTWLRFDNRNPHHGRPSRLVAHPSVPFVTEVPLDAINDETLIQKAVFGYVRDLNRFLRRINRRGLDLPKGWLDALDPSKSTPPGEMQWMPIWPALRLKAGDTYKPDGPNPTLASWNLSRNPGYALPAPVVLVAAETYTEDQPRVSHGFGLRIPMQIDQVGAGLRIVIRSLTAELPRDGELSLTEFMKTLRPNRRKAFRAGLSQYIDRAINSDKAQAITANAALIDPSTYLVDELRFSAGLRDDGRGEFQIKTVGKARRSSRLPRQDSVHVVSAFAFDFDPDKFDPRSGPDLRPVDTETEPLTTHAAPGAAEVFKVPPPDWFDVADPDADYSYRLRRPGRVDPILERYREEEDLENPVPPGDVIALEGPGYRVRLCPEIVHADKDQPGEVKTVTLPGGPVPVPRRDDFSAISAFTNSRLFFDMLTDFGIDPTTFAVRAKRDVQIFYRSGIQPGGGGDGRTINAQVTFDCKDRTELPEINMRLALAELTRWDRDLTLPPDERWAEPLSIGISGRWMLHEFGHYILAARIGQLEFDFAHSAGDAMAAVFYDPMSRLADTRGGVSKNFRGYTFPFVFAPRRHDRNALMGWAWYGALNRSALDAEPGECNHNKAYLTEQILSTTIFRLYLALGGDTQVNSAPDRYVRGRASHMTLFLLIKAIESFASSPSTAEALELAMEDVGLNMTAPLLIDGGPDAWEPALTHKVVRWAFESQGMFPADPVEVLNGPGTAPPVDVYMRNRRPATVNTGAGDLDYGPGSYVPVSLDWGEEALWLLDPDRPVVLGNRGADPAQAVTVRAWVGVVTGTPGDPGWDLGNNITWTQAFAKRQIRKINGESARRFNPLIGLIKAQKISSGIEVVLIEISCPDDRANTDPAALLPAAIADGNGGLSDLPTVPRQLTDLVACDNNLGLMVLR